MTLSILTEWIPWLDIIHFLLWNEWFFYFHCLANSSSQYNILWQVLGSTRWSQHNQMYVVLLMFDSRSYRSVLYTSCDKVCRYMAWLEVWPFSWSVLISGKLLYHIEKTVRLVLWVLNTTINNISYVISWQVSLNDT
jgi:hypothetical protein